jgi:hypothetical protein
MMPTRSNQIKSHATPRSPRKPLLKWAAWAALALGAAGVGGVGTYRGVGAHDQYFHSKTAPIKAGIQREVDTARKDAVEPVREIPATVFRKARRENPKAVGEEFDKIVEKKYAEFLQNNANLSHIEKGENVVLDELEYFDEIVRAKEEDTMRLLEMYYRRNTERNRKFIEFYSKDIPAARKELSEYFADRAKRAEAAVRASKSEYEKKEYAAIAKKARAIGVKVGLLSGAKALLAYLFLVGSAAGTAALIRRRRKR